MFNKSAASYDNNAAKGAAMMEALLFCVKGILTDLPTDARLLVVGAGTGQEVIALAKVFPQWHFTLVEPASAMMDICMEKINAHRLADRCEFHQGYLDTLPETKPFHAATSILVSQFIKDTQERENFFCSISDRLLPNGLLVNADLAGDMTSAWFEEVFKVWRTVLDIKPEAAENVKQQWQNNLAFAPVSEVAETIAAGGFETPVLFFQALFIHAWYARVSK